MNKHDIKRNLPMLSGKLGKCGYDRWWHSFTGISRESGKKRVFFVEYCIMNPELGGKEPVMGDKQFQRPAYLMVKAGCWGKNGIQEECYYGIEDMEVAGTFLKLTAGDCFLSENNIWGRIQGEHTLRWSLQVNKRVPFMWATAPASRCGRSIPLICTGMQKGCGPTMREPFPWMGRPIWSCQRPAMAMRTRSGEEIIPAPGSGCMEAS